MPVDLEERRLQDKIAEAEKLLRSTPRAELPALARSADESEQLPARMALAYIGDDDTSWENAHACLCDESLVDMVLDMEGDKFLTKRTVSRLSGLGLVDPAGLKLSSPAAYALASYLEACLLSAGYKLGVRTPTAATRTVAPATSLPPMWPIKIEFKDIMKHVDEADTFFSYRGIVQVDAKWIMGEVSLKRNMTVGDIQKVLNRQLLDAMKNGSPLQIAMSSSAVDFKGTYCKDGVFPSSLFDTAAFRRPSEYSKLLSEAEHRASGKELLSRMRRDFFSFVTTDFDLFHVRAHLAGVLPHLDSMAVIEVDTASFEADQRAADARRQERQRAKFGQRASDSVG
mmetsp:Transcript_105928/g.332181  ORF Transcript_105928/g.332181 Transcript_105928/m.332181 type:complete len:342 (+) Transcript_105928:144-1169(+)